jgi:hypothetical protein
MATENLTLNQAQLATCKPIPGEGGRALRAYCPFHGSDKQRSLRIDATTGRFNCFACGAWGYTEEAREQWRADRQAERANNPKKNPPGPKPLAAEREAPPPPARSDLPALLSTFQSALPGTWGAKYLEMRGIPLTLAQRHGVGYAAAGTWPGRNWRWGRLVFPHTEPGGEVVNLYGRAVGSDSKTPKKVRHDHLSGAKGYFNAGALRSGEGPLFVCEGAFDALSLIAAGYRRAVAIFGVNGWRWEWARGVRQLVFAMDADRAGAKWRELARQAVLRGQQVAYLSAEAYGGYKDASDAWAAGVLRIGAWPGETADEQKSETAEEAMARQGWVLIDSEILGERIALARDETAAQRAPEGIVVYTLAETGRMGGDPVTMRAVHKAKCLVGGTVTAVRHVPAQMTQEVLAL